MSDQPEGNDNDWSSGWGDSAQDAPSDSPPAPQTPPADQGWSIGPEPGARPDGFDGQPDGFGGQTSPPPTGPPPGFPPQVPPGQQPAGFGPPGFGQQGPPPQQGFGPQGQPGFGQPGFGPQGQPGFGPPGQQGFGPPPQQKSGSGTKVVLIVLGVLGALVLLGVIFAVVVVNRASDVAEDIAGQFDDFDIDTTGDDPVPEGPRLLQTTGSLATGNSTQSFTFQVESSGMVQVDIVSTSGVDPIVELLDSSGTRIDRNDDGGPGLDSRITRTLEPGTYEVVVSAFGSGSGSFQVIVTDL